MNTARSFEDLIVWQRAHQFVLSLYKATERLPKNELFGLTAQMRRAAISIPANIAEGFKKRGVKDKIRLLNVAQGSVEESQYYLILSHDPQYLEDPSLRASLNEISRLLEGYIQAIERRHRSS